MNAPGNLERLRFLVKIVQRESLHLRATDERLFASPLTSERLQSMDTDHAKAEQLDAFVARFARLQDTVGDKFVPTLLQALQEPIKPLRNGLRFLLIISKIATLYRRGSCSCRAAPRFSCWAVPTMHGRSFTKAGSPTAAR